MPEKKVTIYVAEHCVPCAPIKQALRDGQFLINGEEGGSVDMVDIETEEGYTKMLAQELAAVPSAFVGKKECKIQLDEENGVILFECPDD